MDDRKWCKTCKKFRPVEDFKPGPHYRKPGLLKMCSGCRSKVREDNRARKQGHQKYYLEVIKPKRQANEGLRKQNRSNQMRCVYGIDAAEFERMSREQGGLCACCGRLPRGGRHPGLHVDHDHKTGAVRGLLCHHCNFGLGQFGDSVDRLFAAVNYLRRGRTTEFPPLAFIA